MMSGLDKEGEAALEGGIVPGLLHLVHVTASLHAPSRGGQPFPLAVRVQVNPSDIRDTVQCSHGEVKVETDLHHSQ